MCVLGCFSFSNLQVHCQFAFVSSFFPLLYTIAVGAALGITLVNDFLKWLHPIPVYGCVMKDFTFPPNMDV